MVATVEVIEVAIHASSSLTAHALEHFQAFVAIGGRSAMGVATPIVTRPTKPGGATPVVSIPTVTRVPNPPPTPPHSTVIQPPKTTVQQGTQIRVKR